MKKTYSLVLFVARGTSWIVSALWYNPIKIYPHQGSYRESKSTPNISCLMKVASWLIGKVSPQERLLSLSNIALTPNFAIQERLQMYSIILKNSLYGGFVLYYAYNYLPNFPFVIVPLCMEYLSNALVWSNCSSFPSLSQNIWE